VKETLEKSEKVKAERLLGSDPQTGKNVYVRIGRFGPMVQIGEAEEEEKPKFAGLKKGQTMDSLTLDEALKLFEFPRQIGDYEEAELTVAIGRFGPYVKHKSAFYSLAKTDDPASIDADRAIEIIEEKRRKDRERVIKVFEEDDTIQVLNGRFGPYIAQGKTNYKIPKSVDPQALTLEEVRQIISNPASASKSSVKASAKRNTSVKSTSEAEKKATKTKASTGKNSTAGSKKTSTKNKTSASEKKVVKKKK
jgi:DNA topoisomerase-1